MESTGDVVTAQYGNSLTYNRSKNLATLGQGSVTITEDDETGSDSTERLNRDVTKSEYDIFKHQQQVEMDAKISQALLNGGIAGVIGDYAQEQLLIAQAYLDEAGIETDPAKQQALLDAAADIYSKWGDYGTYRLGLHTLTGFVVGDVTGGATALATAGTVPAVHDILLDMGASREVADALILAGSAAIGNISGDVASMANTVDQTLNNFLSHDEVAKRNALMLELAECQQQECGREEEIQKSIDEINETDQQRNIDAIVSCNDGGPRSEECLGTVALLEAFKKGYEENREDAYEKYMNGDITKEQYIESSSLERYFDLEEQEIDKYLHLTGSQANHPLAANIVNGTIDTIIITPIEGAIYLTALSFKAIGGDQDAIDEMKSIGAGIVEAAESPISTVVDSFIAQLDEINDLKAEGKLDLAEQKIAGLASSVLFSVTGVTKLIGGELKNAAGDVEDIDVNISSSGNTSDIDTPVEGVSNTDVAGTEGKPNSGTQAGGADAEAGFSNIDHLPNVQGDRLLNVLDSQGVKYSPENVVDVRRTSDGRVVFLETGSGGQRGAGLAHIVEEHAADFARKGIPENQISKVVMDALENNKVVGYQGKGTGRPVFEVSYNGVNHKIAITVSNNGFVVGANPR